MNDERGSWYLLTGLVLGVVLGLLYAWKIQPVAYTDTFPSSLQGVYKDQYRALIASAYLGNPNITRARARLQLLQDPDMFQALSVQAQRTLAESGSAADARALGLLAVALGQAAPGPGVALTPVDVTASPGPLRLPTAGAPPGPTLPPLPFDTPATDLPSPPPALPETSTLTATAFSTDAPAFVVPPTATFPPRPTPSATNTRVPTVTPGPPFLLLGRDKICDESFPTPLIQIQALDRFNKPLSGVLVIVSWPGGEERFYTGLKPEKGAGYADFSPAAGILYSVRVGENSQPENDLAAVMCMQGAGDRHWGAWRLRFVQP